MIAKWNPMKALTVMTLVLQGCSEGFKPKVFDSNSSQTLSCSSNYTLQWDRPTTNLDGTPLTDLSGYILGIGTASGQYTQIVTINDVTSDRFALPTLGAGTYFFALKSVNSQGMQSAYSQEVSATFNSCANLSLKFQDH